MSQYDDWIKVRCKLASAPDAQHEKYRVFLRSIRQANPERFAGLSDDHSRFMIVGALVSVWSAVNARAIDDRIPNESAGWINNDVAYLSGFADAMVAAGWLRVLKRPKCLEFPQFSIWNKTKDDRNKRPPVPGAQRTRDWRDRKNGKGSCDDGVTKCDDTVTSRDVTVTTEIEIEREKSSKSPQPPADAGGVGAKRRKGKRTERQRFLLCPDFPPGFEAFWASYPSAGQKDKAVAAWEWRRAKVEPIADAIVATVMQWTMWWDKHGIRPPKAGDWIKAGNYHESKEVD
jgi:hypothetical protein